MHQSSFTVEVIAQRYEEARAPRGASGHRIDGAWPPPADCSSNSPFYTGGGLAVTGCPDDPQEARLDPVAAVELPVQKHVRDANAEGSAAAIRASGRRPQTFWSSI